MFLTRDELLALGDVRKTAEAEIPDSGGTVRVQALSAGERFEVSTLSTEHKLDPTSLFVVFGAVDQNGARLFPQVQDVDAVAALPAGAVDAIAEKVMAISGLGSDAAADAEKNSAKTLSGTSSSASVSNSDEPRES